VILLGAKKKNLSLYIFTLIFILGIIIISSTLNLLNTVHDDSVPIYTYEIIQTYPHDPTAYTQGLAFDNGYLYEGTGLLGRSSLRKVELESGEVVQIHRLSSELFGEGITVYREKIFQVTWRSHTGFVYDKNSFEVVDTFEIATEGWGLTHDGSSLILSDGTSTLHFLDLDTYEETRTVEVFGKNGPVLNINELEYVRGEVLANIWKTESIARIDPESGLVVGWIDLSGLSSHFNENTSIDVLNGIAFDGEEGRLFVTGKLWPKLFEIKITPIK
jgi:glutamine cyclotransferase